jgi:hypothetical protein
MYLRKCDEKNMAVNQYGRYLFIGLAIPLLSDTAQAHCPLCTAGAGAAAAGAAWIGVSSMVIGILLGAFGLALGLWLGGLIKRSYVKYQRWLIGIFSFLTTVLPLQPVLKEYTSIYLSLTGEYGSLLNRTYLIDYFLVGSLLGAGIVIAAPYLSSYLTQTRQGKMLPYQGVSITFGLLLIASLASQFLL